MTLPNLFIVGAPKCATTALAHYLSAHPEIGAMPKEIHHFGSDLDYRRPGGRIDRAAYVERANAVGVNAKVVLDASVFYLCSETAAQEIREFNPDARIIIMLRKPSDMIRSLHQQMIKARDEDILDLAEALRAEPARRGGERIPSGAIGINGLFYRHVASYSDQVARYLEVFPQAQVKVILYDDLRNDVRGVYDDACRFAGVEPDPEADLSPVNEAASVRSGLLVEFQRRIVYRYDLYNRARHFLPSAVRKPLWRAWKSLLYKPGKRELAPPGLEESLTEEFAAEVSRLEGITGRNLSNWKPLTDTGQILQNS